MDKLVKVTVTGRPISLTNSVKAFGHHGPIMMSTEDIFRCLISDAEVIEVNPNNVRDTIRLSLANYKIDNFKKEEPKITEVKDPVVITPLPNATPDILDNLKELTDYIRENPELEEEATAELVLEATPLVGELHIAEPTAPAIDSVDEAIASDFIPKSNDKPNYHQNNRNNNHNHGKNKNRR